jgi:hypothetical protein
MSPFSRCSFFSEGGLNPTGRLSFPFALALFPALTSMSGSSAHKQSVIQTKPINLYTPVS